MRIRFWGTRGSIASPRATTSRYGANTSCVQVQTSHPTPLVLDAGSGLVRMGEAIMAEPAADRPSEFYLLLTHLHWDHVLGLPFFIPIHLPGNQLHIYGADPERVRGTVDRLFHPSYSPIDGAHNLAASLDYRSIGTTPQRVGGARVRTAALCHPHPSPRAPTVAYRIEADGANLVYATDHEAGADPEADERLVSMARGAGLLIHDAHFTTEQYESRKGWGHSTVDRAVQLAARAGVGWLVLFHHNPDHDDDTLDELLEHARRLAPQGLQVDSARDGGELEL